MVWASPQTKNIYAHFYRRKKRYDMPMQVFGRGVNFGLSSPPLVKVKVDAKLILNVIFAFVGHGNVCQTDDDRRKKKIASAPPSVSVCL